MTKTCKVITKFLSSLILGAFLVATGVATTIPASALPAPEVTLQSPRWIIYNLNDDKALSEQDADTSVPVASLTKIMTAVIILENNFTPTQKITITPEMTQGLNEFAIIGLQAGQQISIDELMYALMLPSAGDAAQALAINDSGSISVFADKMNKKAAELGLKNTHFSNPVGFDADNYSSARDIATLTKYALKVANFRTYFDANEQFLPSLDKTVTKTIRDTAKKAGIDSSAIIGAKTGFTNAAGLNLSSTSLLNNVNYLMVNLNDPTNGTAHLTDALTLYNYYDTNYAYRTVKAKDEGIMEIPVKDSSQKTYILTAPEEIKVFLPQTLDLAKLKYNYDGVDEITRGTEAGTQLGQITVALDGENLTTFPVYLDQQIDFYPYELWICCGAAAGLIILVILRRKFIHRPKR